MISRRIHIGSLALLLVVIAYPIPAQATTRHVPTPTYPTIAAGLNAALPGDDVLVDCGTYNEHGLVVPSGVWLHSQTGQPSCVTIDAHGIDRVMSGSALSPTTRIEGITLTHGSVPTGRGGGFLCNGGSPTFINCAFEDNFINSNGHGGAASFSNANAPTFTGCTFNNNRAEVGGAVELFETPGGSFTDCVFSSNFNPLLEEEDPRGGGIFCFRGTGLTLTGCLFYGNSSYFRSGSGGAIDIDDTLSAFLSNCTLVDNYSFYGSAISLGVFFPSSVEVSNTIIAFNRRFDGNPGTGPVECGVGSGAVLTCCDVFGNRVDFGNTADWVGCLDGQLPISGNLSDDPLFCDGSARDYQLQENSPCAPAHSPPGCGLIGALPVGCGPGSNLPPDCSGAYPSDGELLPPKHQFQAVDILGVTDPDGDPVTITVTGITQDEPLNTIDDDIFCPDGQIVNGRAQLRVERTGTRSLPGNGRVYVIAFTADDGQGGTCQGQVSVCVPHDQSPGHACIDDGQTVNSLGPCGPSLEPPSGPGHDLAQTPAAEITAVQLGAPEMFDGEAVITYALPEDSDVQLAVFDIAGRHVATLENSRQTKGPHAVTLDTGRLARGVYFYRIRAAGVSLSRPLVLTR